MESPFGATPPTLRQLELLLSLASADGIASAGARIGMTPSATSHALRALESAMGTALVDRQAPGLALTHAGQQVLPHARDLFAALQLMMTAAQASAGLKSGVLRLGSFGASSSLKLLPPLLKSFRRHYPGIVLSVVERPDAQVEQDLQERRLELGVVTLPRPGFETLSLARDELVAVLPVDHPLARARTVTPQALAAQPLILTRAGSQGLVAQMFARAGLRPQVTHELSQLLSILAYVAGGEGVSVAAALALPADYPGVVYRPLAPGAQRRIGLACLDVTRLSPAATAFWRHVQKSKRPV